MYLHFIKCNKSICSAKINQALLFSQPGILKSNVMDLLPSCGQKGTLNFSNNCYKFCSNVSLKRSQIWVGSTSHEHQHIFHNVITYWTKTKTKGRSQGSRRIIKYTLTASIGIRWWVAAAYQMHLMNWSLASVITFMKNRYFGSLLVWSIKVCVENNTKEERHVVVSH